MTQDTTPIEDELPEVTPVDIDTLSQGVSELSLLKQTIETLTAENASLKESSLRARADLENFRRRSQQEVDTFKKYAAEKVVLEFLPILDSFHLALSNSVTSTDESQKLKDGFDLILKQFLSALDKLNVEPIEALNCPFDPHCHQAISKQETEGVPPETVVQEVQKGFKLHDRVIRPSLVIVS